MNEPAPRHCPACRLARGACWCSTVVPHTGRTRVVILQHPREAKNPVGTARMAHLGLPGSALLVGIDFEEDAEFRRLVDEAGASSVVLSAAPEARPVAELAARPGPLTLWVIDGTWWQAGKIWRRNPTLARLPAYRVEPTAPSRYDIRAEPAPHCLSTVEAIAAALDAAAGAPGRHDTLLAPLLWMVGRQHAFAADPARVPRRLPRPPSPPPVFLPPALAGRVGDALLVYTEANAVRWERDRPPSDELVQLLAVRPATGERFAALVRPARGFGPAVRLALGDADLDAAEPVAAALARFRAFLRPADVSCAWGFAAWAVLGGDDGLPAAPIDVRGWCHRWLRGRRGRRLVPAGARAGSIEAAAELAGIAEPPPRYPGRAGRRLAILEGIFARLVEAG